MNIPDGWAVGLVKVAREGWTGAVPGWVKAPLGIDWRWTWDDDDYAVGGWTITHLRSGYAVGFFAGCATDVMALAESMMAENWDFDEPKDMPAETKANVPKIWEGSSLERYAAGHALFGKFRPDSVGA